MALVDMSVVEQRAGRPVASARPGGGHAACEGALIARQSKRLLTGHLGLDDGGPVVGCMRCLSLLDRMMLPTAAISSRHVTSCGDVTAEMVDDGRSSAGPRAVVVGGRSICPVSEAGLW